jgi:parallel beta-helix repeat protein
MHEGIRMNKTILLIALMMVCVAGGVMATCSGKERVPTENQKINQTTYLCSGDYLLKDLDKNGAINVTNKSLTIYCNNTFIYGNKTTNSKGFFIGGLTKNISLIGCKVYGYNYGYYFYGMQTSKSSNNKILNSYSAHSKNNVFFQYNDNFTIRNNTIVGCDDSTRGGMIATFGYGFAKNATIEKNKLDGNSTCAHGIRISGNANKFNVFNNTLKSVDRGIYVGDSKNIKVADNIINNATINQDYYMTGIMVHDIHYGTDSTNRIYPAVNISVYNNNVNISGVGILIQSGNNISLNNNRIRVLTYAEKATGSYEVDDSGTQPCAIMIQEVRKHDLGDGNESLADNYAHINNYSARNIKISNNIFDSSTECFLVAQGTKNLTHDINSGYWFVNFRMPVNFMDEYKWYMSNSVSEMQMYRPYSGFYRNKMFFSYKNAYPISFWKYNYSISKTVEVYKNVNKTASYNFSRYNISTTSRIFNSTSSTYITGKNNHTETIGAGKRVFIASFNNVKIDALATTITSIDFNETEDRFNIEGSGTGNSILSGLSYYGDYLIYHNDRLQGKSSRSIYFIDRFSNWSFVQGSQSVNLSNPYLIYPPHQSAVITSTVNLNYTAYAPGGEQIRYLIYNGTDGSHFTLLVNHTKSNYTVEGLTAGKRFYWVVVGWIVNKTQCTSSDIQWFNYTTNIAKTTFTNPERVNISLEIDTVANETRFFAILFDINGTTYTRQYFENFTSTRENANLTLNIEPRLRLKASELAKVRR